MRKRFKMGNVVVEPRVVKMREGRDSLSVELQAIILKREGEKELENEQTITCDGCAMWEDGNGCRVRLLPITSTGEPCPYR